jgi:hypothetical protein
MPIISNPCKSRDTGMHSLMFRKDGMPPYLEW